MWVECLPIYMVISGRTFFFNNVQFSPVVIVMLMAASVLHMFLVAFRLDSCK